MRKLTVPLLCLGGVACLSAQSPGQPQSGSSAIEHFRQQHPRALMFEFETDSRIRKLAGRTFATGPTARASAEQFRADHAAIFGVTPAELRIEPIGGRDVQPLMYDAATGVYRLHVVTYQQHKDEIPVHGARLKVVMRSGADHPAVLASSNLRPLGAFALPDDLGAAVDGARVADRIRARFGAGVRAGQPAVIVWTGTDEALVAPRLATRSIVDTGRDKLEVISDAATGEIMHDSSILHRGGTVNGSVSGFTTEGIAADLCEDEVPMPLPYVTVTSGLNATTTDADGNFSIAPSGGFPPSVNSSLDGVWFDVFDFFGFDTLATAGAESPIEIEFNTANTEAVRAQVNGYVHSNVVRDFVIGLNPSYPTLNDPDFPVTVNRDDYVCPQNAWYDPDEVSINFCESSFDAPNTAWSSVIYHEYGHHLVNAGGSGQGQYGEGMGDVMSILLLDDPLLGLGFYNNCTDELRNADNTLQYPCSGSIHFCGQLISGCIWDIRNALVQTNPDDYLQILGNLAVNSILVHTGNQIEPSIAVDYLTLDDDDANILNGTPHSDAILTGFGAHNMIDLIDFSFPDGFPDFVSPAGGTTIRVDVLPVTFEGEPDSARFFVDAGSGFVEHPTTHLGSNQYEATFPAAPCGGAVSYYFTADSAGGGAEATPGAAPDQFYTATAADGIGALVFDDNFESDQGWNVSNSPGLGDGTWNRGVPVGGGDRGDPPTDGDGTGQCYLTDNVDGNSDVDDGSTTLTSPIMDASTGMPFITYSRWYSNNAGDAPFQDVMVVEVSDDGGSDWTLLEEVGPDTPDAAGGWVHKQFLVADYVTPTDQFRIRFIASDTDPQSVVEAGVDGVQLVNFACDAGCDEDVNGDSAVDVDDLVDVIVAWGAAGGSADINDDGVVNVDDLVLVILAWGPCS